MKALVLHDSGIDYQTDREMPRLTSCFDVLVKVHFAGICRTDIGIAERNIPAKANIVMGHEFCGRIAGFVNGDDEMEGWHMMDALSSGLWTMETEDTNRNGAIPIMAIASSVCSSLGL